MKYRLFLVAAIFLITGITNAQDKPEQAGKVLYKTLIADSKIKAEGTAPDKPLQNIGCAASDEEVAAFIQILEKATKITPAEKTAILERFKKNRS
jgi:hypothetical protein